MDRLFFRRRRGAATVAAGAFTAFAVVHGFCGFASADFANSVQSYEQGTVAYADGVSTYNNSSTALGQPNRIAGAGIGFPGPLTPFNPPYEQSEMVSVGVGGQLTLEFATPIVVSHGALQVGIFTSTGINDPTFSGVAESPARTFAGKEYAADRSAVVEVASELSDFKSLGRVLFTNPTQGYANQSTPYEFPAGPIPSDFDLPFDGTLASFDGESASDISDALLRGSAGGTWLSVPGSIDLDAIRYVRISEPRWVRHSDGSLATEMQSLDDPLGNGQPFFKPADLFVDGVNVIVPEPAVALPAVALMVVTVRRRRRGA